MHIRIRTRELFRALRFVRRLNGKVAGDAAWSFEEDRLVVHWAGWSQSFPGEGEGRGVVRVRAVLMHGIARGAIQRDVNHVAWADGELRFGSTVVGAPLVPGEAADAVPQLLNLRPRVLDLALLPHRHDADTIARAGLSELLERVRRKRARRVAAAAELLQPFGVRAEDLEAFLDAQLSARAGAARRDEPGA
jgi:hypothetical protein